jgi:hypothetical protein
MSSSELENWAFDTFTTLKGKLAPSAGGTLVCGFISSQHGEGRSTWIKALAKAARRQGLRVMSINAGSTADEGDWSNVVEEPSQIPPIPSENMSLLSQIDQTLTAGTEGASLNVQSLRWIWNVENRRQWRKAMEKCGAMESAAVFIELPPVNDRESVLLAEHVPNVVWLCGQGRTNESQTRSEIEMLRCAGVQLVGAVMNNPQP